MDNRQLPQIPANCSPVFSIAGHVITQAEATARAALPRPVGVLSLKAAA